MKKKQQHLQSEREGEDSAGTDDTHSETVAIVLTHTTNGACRMVSKRVEIERDRAARRKCKQTNKPHKLGGRCLQNFQK